MSSSFNRCEANGAVRFKAERWVRSPPIRAEEGAMRQEWLNHVLNHELCPQTLFIVGNLTIAPKRQEAPQRADL